MYGLFIISNITMDVKYTQNIEIETIAKSYMFDIQ